MRMIKLLFILFFSLLIGCKSTNKDQNKEQVHFLLDWWPNPNHVPIYVAQAKGFFAQEDIDLDILKSHDPPETVAYLLTKRADVALYYTPALLKAAQRTDQLQVLGVLVDTPLRAFVFREDSGIQEPTDLNQKVLGANPEGVTATYIRSLAAQWNIQFKDVRKMQFDPIIALMMNSVDVASGVYWNVEPERLRALGLPCTCFKLSDLSIPLYDELIFVSSHQFLDKNPAFRERFQKAIKKSIAYCKEEPADAFEIYLSFHPDKGKKTVEWERKSWDLTYPLLSNDVRVDQEKWQKFYDWMKEVQLITHEYDIAALLRTREKVAKKGENLVVK